VVRRGRRKSGSVRRSEATKRLEGLLARVVGGNGSYLPRVREVWIFGSYARGALAVGDVDLAVEFDQTRDEAGMWFATLLAGGFDHLGALRRELRGSQRALEIHFNELDDLRKEGFEPQLLWRRGDSLEQAHARLAALAPDASAQRAPRDTVHPLLAEVEKSIPRPGRQEFSLFMWAGWLDAKLVELPGEQAANAVTRRRFAVGCRSRCPSRPTRSPGAGRDRRARQAQHRPLARAPQMPKPADLSVTGLRRRHVLTTASACQGGTLRPPGSIPVDRSETLLALSRELASDVCSRRVSSEVGGGYRPRRKTSCQASSS
jgi:hypothetical protein